MNIVPIILTFDSNLSFPASVCISSLLMSAGTETFYDVFVLYSGTKPAINGLELIEKRFDNFKITYRDVGGYFEDSYEIRGITHTAYYRLLASELIPEYDKAVYLDVDIISRRDYSTLLEINIDDYLVAAVYASSMCVEKDGREYSQSLGLVPGLYFCSGFLLMNLREMRRLHIVEEFKKFENHKFRYQDQDILNIVCKDKILPLQRFWSMGVSDFYYIQTRDERLSEEYANSSDSDAITFSNIHFNGTKPWKDLCPNFDIWWEYYRKSPVFDEKYYFSFFYNKLEYLDKLPLMKRIKILVRYFVYGKAKDI